MRDSQKLSAATQELSDPCAGEAKRAASLDAARAVPRVSLEGVAAEGLHGGRFSGLAGADQIAKQLGHHQVGPEGGEQYTDAARDAANARMANDPDMAAMDMPFDGQRMFWGGFEVLLDR